MPMALAAQSTTVDFSVISSVADAVVGLVGDAVSMVTANPILFLGIGIALFGSAIGIVRSFL